jgi:hypothetical protein
MANCLTKRKKMIPETINSNILRLLEETFTIPEGIYLDRAKGGLQATLAAIPAELASRETPNGRSIAAHVEHLRFYLVALHGYLNGATSPTDWNASWQTRAVSSQAWEKLQQDLNTAYQALLLETKAMPENDLRLSDVMAIVVHTAYHFGAIRQLLALA